MIIEPIVVKIIAAPVACKNGINESWRNMAEWAEEKLQVRFGDRVSVKYFDLFDPNCPTLPQNCQLPVVFVNQMLISAGEKISIPLIRKKIEEILV